MTSFYFSYWVGNSNARWHISRSCTNVNVPSQYRGDDWYDDATKRAQHAYGGGTTSSSWYAVGSECATVKETDTICGGVDFSASGLTGQVKMRVHLDGNIIAEKDFGTVERCYWAFKIQVGIPDGTPTYLETLDKLDQWSTAQYDPTRGNELNL